MGKNMNNSEIIKLLEEWYPNHFAEQWDNVGLLAGRKTQEIHKILVVVDMTDEILKEAVEREVDLIISHHPLIFSALKKVNSEDFISRRILTMLENGISYYAIHTNYDVCRMGELSADYLHLKNQKVLAKGQAQQVYKLAVYVPKTHEEVVENALYNAGAGGIGNYKDCSFKISGEGSFRPMKGADPYLGSENVKEVVEEVKIETIIIEEDLSRVLHSMVEAHPYEEPAYDVYRLERTAKISGFGRVGELKAKMKLRDIASYVKKQFSLETVRVFGDLNEEITHAAILPGSGRDFIKEAVKSPAQVYITGDISHHDGIDAAAQKLNIIDAGHYGLEHIFIRDVKMKLEEELNGVEVIGAKVMHPFTVL
jgi:dinuclear metal center YbgI/SA1388 family protein